MSLEIDGMTASEKIGLDAFFCLYKNPRTSYGWLYCKDLLLNIVPL